jgi:hypothetical protein
MTLADFIALGIILVLIVNTWRLDTRRRQAEAKGMILDQIAEMLDDGPKGIVVVLSKGEPDGIYRVGVGRIQGDQLTPSRN